MNRLLARLALVIGVVLALPTAAGAQSTPTVMLLHGIPGATVDVAVDGAVVIPGFEPGTMQDLSSFAGETLTNVEVRAAGTTDVVIGPIPSLDVPASGNWTVVAHLTADGTPTLTPFENDTSALAAGQGRLTVRHTAAAPAVDVVLADDSRPFTNLANPNEAAADLPAGEISGAQVAPTGGDPIAPVPTVTLNAGSNLIVYAVGGLEDGSFTFYTQTIEGLGGDPAGVPTGNSLIPRDDDAVSGVVVAALIGSAVLAAAGGVVLARRRVSA